MTHSRWLVVILTHDESATLVLTCIRSVIVAAHRLSTRYVEDGIHIRVVDDSQPRFRDAWLDEVRSLGVEVLEHRGTIASKRNSGCDGFDADIIAFTDADCDVDSEWLCAHSSVYMLQPKVAAVVGKTLHNVEAFWRYQAAEYARFLIGFRLPDLMQYTFWGPCSNFSVRHEAFRSISGFDAIHFSNASEDVDLGLRLTAKGYVIACAASAPVRHNPEAFARGILRRAWGWGNGEAGLLIGHPRFRAIAPPDLLAYSLIGVLMALAGLVFANLTTLGALIGIFVVVGPLVESRSEHVTWRIVITGRILRMLFRLGCCLRLVKARKWNLLAAKMNYGSGQYRAEWPDTVRPMWEFLAFGAVCVALATVG